MSDNEVKSQRLEFDNKPSFMRQLLITDQAKKSLIKPKIESTETGLNLDLIDSVKKFLEDAKRDKSESTNGDQLKSRSENGDQLMENGDSNLSKEHSSSDSQEIGGQEIGGSDKQIGVEFDLLMYREDSDSESDESDESD